MNKIINWRVLAWLLVISFWLTLFLEIKSIGYKKPIIKKRNSRAPAVINIKPIIKKNYRSIK